MSGQRLDGWLATVANTFAQTGSKVWMPLKSQTRAKGWWLSSLRRARWTRGTLNRSMLPAKATTRQPSWVWRWMSIGNSQAPHPARWGTSHQGNAAGSGTLPRTDSPEAAVRGRPRRSAYGARLAMTSRATSLIVLDRDRFCVA